MTEAGPLSARRLGLSQQLTGSVMAQDYNIMINQRDLLLLITFETHIKQDVAL